MNLKLSLILVKNYHFMITFFYQSLTKIKEIMLERIVNIYKKSELIQFFHAIGVT